MKTNKLLFAAAALMALTACSSDEQTESMGQRVPVKLTCTTMDATETRAAQDLNQGTFATGETVKVRISNTGASEWTDYTFTTGDAGTMSPASTVPYYPAGSQNIDIVAYYPATAGTSFTVATDQTADADYKASDLMFASVTDQAKQADAVNLAFSHKMAKLNVNITAGQGVSSITSISVLNVKPTVSFNQATGVVGEASGSATTIAMSNEGAAIIPAQTIDGGLLSIVTDKGTATYSVSNKAFTAGNLYTINITVNLRAVGTTTAITGWISEGTVTVNPVVSIRTSAGLEAVDMGLSVKWANMNVGAEEDTDFGTYFAWGECIGYTVVGNSYTPVAGNLKTNFTWATYSLCNGTFGNDGEINSLNKYNSRTDHGYVDNKEVLELVNDAAAVNWAGSWRMPTKEEWAELVATKNNTENYTWTWYDGSTTQYKGTTTKGWLIERKFTSAKLFLESGSWRMDGTTNSSPNSNEAHYWTSTHYSQTFHEECAYFIQINKDKDYVQVDWGDRYRGRVVRAVTP